MNTEQQWPNVPELVQTMFDAQNGSCGYCGIPMFIKRKVSLHYYQTNKSMVATFEHVKPHSKGGKYTLANGACVCDRCNTLRKNMPLEEFFEHYEELLQYSLEKPARDQAKKELNTRKNGYMVAWYARMIGVTVDEVFQSFTNKNSHEIVRIT